MSKPIMYDGRILTYYTVWHEDVYLEKLINDIMKKLQPDRFVETGTHMGWTLMYMAKKYPALPMYSVEIDNGYYAISVHNCEPYPNIKLYHMSSPDFLKSIYDEVLSQGLTLFWLDAHWWKPVPLRDECKLISTLDKYVVLIDDFACNNPRFGGDVFDGVENNLAYVADVLGKKCFRPNYPSIPPYKKGYGLFLKGVEYQVPEYMKEEELKE